MADSKIAGDNISEETYMGASQEQHETIDEMLARLRLETKQVQNKEAEMKKAAAQVSKAEQKANTRQVDEDISKPSTKLREKQLKEVASLGYNSSSSNNSKDRAKERTSSSDVEWTVVLPRKGRHARSKVQEEEEEEGEPWGSDDLEIDPQRQARLINNMEISMKKIESSEFYKAFLYQLKSPQVSDHFRLVLGSETQLQMVMYGIGSIECYEPPRYQLSVAILMKREFDWVGNNIQVFDPVLSPTESSVLKSLGCTVLSVNEQARREALKPSIFFMPHCEAKLYSNLLEANWRMDRLSKIALFGNSFQKYEEQVSFDQKIIHATKRIIATRRITSEFAIKTVSDDYFAAFHDSSWHFFSPAGDSELQLLFSEGS